MKTLFTISSIFIFSLIFAQEVEVIKLNKNIKDKKGLIKSLTVIDNRTDKNIGTITDEKKSVSLKFENEDLKSYIENWFKADNKDTGNTDITLMVEDIKAYQEQDALTNQPIPKLRVRISSFLKRNDKYYFINRFDNIAVVNENKAAFSQKYFADQISNLFTNFIKSSYKEQVSSNIIPENQINSYDAYLLKNNLAMSTTVLKDGVYRTVKNFTMQVPDTDFIIEKNKKGEVKRFMYKDERVHEELVFCYVENGKAYRFIPGGFVEMFKDDNGYYFMASRKQLFEENVNGAMIGAMTGGAIGALIGGLADAASTTSNSVRMTAFGFPNKTESKVYLDFLTGRYIFTQ